MSLDGFSITYSFFANIIVLYLFAGNGMIGYVAKERVDDLLVLPEAVQIMKAGASACLISVTK